MAASRSRCMSCRPSRALLLAAATLAFGPACGPTPLALTAPDAAGPVDAGADSALELLGAPLIFNPTSSSFGINVALRRGDPTTLRARVRDGASAGKRDIGPPTSPASDIAQWTVSGLQPGRRYTYEIYDTCPGDPTACDRLLYLGSAVTTRAPGTTFTFAAVADTHIEPRDPIPPGSE